MVVGKRSITQFDKWFSYSVILLPFLYQYKGIGSFISMGEVLIAIMTLIELWQDQFKLKRPNKCLFAFYAVSLISTAICMGFSYFNMSAAATLIIRLVFYALVIIVAREHFDLDCVSRLYTGLVFLFSLYLIIQYAYHITTGGYLPIYLNSNLQFPPEARPENLAVYYRWFFRPSSLFLEPGYFTLYVMPAVCMIVFSQRRTGFELVTLLTTIIAILLSTGSAGITSLLIIFAVYFFDGAENRSKYKLFMKIAVVVSAICGVVIFFTVSDVAALTLGRLKSGGSFANRITRGIITFSELDFFHQIVGVGLNNLEPYMLYYGMSTEFDEGNLNYTASFIQTLNFSGIVGFCVLAIFIGNLIIRTIAISNVRDERNYLYGKGVLWSLLFLIIFIMSFEAMLFTYRFAFYMIVYEALCRRFIAERNSLI